MGLSNEIGVVELFFSCLKHDVNFWDPLSSDRCWGL